MLSPGVHVGVKRLLGLLAAVGALLLAAGPAQAAFPGRNGLLVLQPARGGGLLLTDTTGRHVQAICTGSALCGRPRTPRFGPDGLDIAFTDGLTGRPAVVAADGTCMWCLLGPPLTALTGAASALTPAGLALAGAKGLWQVSLRGAAPQRLETGAIQDVASAANGTLALVVRGSIWTLAPGHAHAHWLAYGSQPSFAPDGRRLAFVHNGWIWSIPVHGGRTARLARGSSPAFSPDGRQLAFVGSGGRVYVAGVRGRRGRAVPGVRARYVDWQPLPRRAATHCAVAPTRQIVAETPEAVISTDGSTWWGCLLAIGKRLVLARQPGTGQSTLTLAELAGRFAGFGLAQSDGSGNCSTAVVRVDLASAAQTSLYSQNCKQGQNPRGVDSLVLDTSGFLGWHAFEQVAVPQPMVAAACPRTALCLAGDAHGNLASSASPTGGATAWSLSKVVPSFGGPMACAGASLCVAVTATGSSVATSTNPAGGASAWTTPTVIDAAHTIAGVSCPSSSLCVAVDNAGDVLTSTAPATGPWTGTQVTGGSLDGISCPGIHLCVAVGANGLVITSTDPTGGTWTASTAESGVAGLAGVSCPSASLCVATDSGGNVLSSSDAASADPTWTTVTTLPVIPGATATAPTCASTTLCVIPDGTGVVASSDPTNSKSWIPTQLLTGAGNRLAALTCAPASSLCLAADENGDILTSTDPATTSPTWNSAGVDVPSCGACIAEQVYAEDDRGRQAVDAVQPGPGHMLGSLALAGNSTLLSWAHSGQPESAQLK
jgi:Tol biopolymer transport system component